MPFDYFKFPIGSRTCFALAISPKIVFKRVYTKLKYELYFTPLSQEKYC